MGNAGYKLWSEGYRAGIRVTLRGSDSEDVKKEYFARGLESAARSLRRKKLELWMVRFIARSLDRRARKVRKGK